MILYPTIQTSKGAKLFFYEPQTVNVTNWDGLSHGLTTISIPDGDGYTDITIASAGATYGDGNLSITPEGGTATIIGNGTDYDEASIGRLTYNVTYNAFNETKIYLISPQGGNVEEPALVILEEKDDNTQYHAIVVTTETGDDADDGIGVSDVVRSWHADGRWDAVSLASDSKKTKEIDLWGTIALVDGSDSDQKSATITYPDEQVSAQVFIAEESAAITAGSVSSGAGGNIVVVKDSEVSSVSGKNLVVVGGSCINSVAAKILGSDSPVCGDDFSALTNVGAGQYLIQVVESPYNADKVAMLVAGYNAADTENAVTKAKEGVMTDVGTSDVYPMSS
jgi:hypothetical protein